MKFITTKTYRSVWTLLAGVFLCLTACATPREGIFVGTDADIEYIVPKEVLDEQARCKAQGEICVTDAGGIGIGRMDDVEIERVAGDRVLIVRYNGHHSPTHAWIKRTAVAFMSDFKPMAWTADPYLRLCQQGGCYYYDVATDGRFSMRYRDNCSIINVYGNCTYWCPYDDKYYDRDCHDVGQMLVYKDIVRIQYKSDYWDYLLQVPGKGLCWATELVLSKSCVGIEWWPRSKLASQEQIDRYKAPRIDTELLVADTSDSAKAAGLQPLEGNNLDAGIEEIRIWQGFGLEDTLTLVRIKIDPSGKVSGGVYSIHSNPSTYKDPDDNSHCPGAGNFGHREACQLRPGPLVDWQTFNAELTRTGLWALPDSGAVQNYDVADSDGMELLVELREGSTYRAFAYQNPGYSKTPQGKVAAEILDLFAKFTEAYPQPTALEKEK